MSGPADPMGQPDFERMIAAYGADPLRWPENGRAAAIAFADTIEGRRIIASAAGLDAALKTYEAPHPSAHLHALILDAGAKRMASRRWLRRLVIGATMIGLGLAGGLTGAAAVLILLPPPSLVTGESATAFGDLQGDYIREVP